jgi:hypothetical protein
LLLFFEFLCISELFLGSRPAVGQIEDQAAVIGEQR